MLGEGVDFFPKPFSTRRLIEKIREILDRPKQPVRNASLAVFPTKRKFAPAELVRVSAGSVPDHTFEITKIVPPTRRK
jgi:DNA-binding response OmpR family regulator